MNILTKYYLKNNLLTKYFIFKNRHVILIKKQQNYGKGDILYKKTLGYFNLLKTQFNQLTGRLRFLSKKLLNKKNSSFINKFLIKNKQIYKKVLKLNGLGFRVFKFLIKKNNIFFLKFKLGFSHKLYIKIPNELTVSCRKKNKIIIQGNNKQTVTNFSKKIQFLKIPEIYSGKGILFTTDVIKIKPGKKKN
uniref:Ribosomal protein L6 n=1 Tax=Cyanophora paradoxa TaxID=2762 RepID=E9P1D2_CYAPA|nr:ribosomal protein L6 [Cyanophora paradoxa]ADW79184.1 ribosomal protein L6 [Cyanophora paradoxa]